MHTENEIGAGLGRTKRKRFRPLVVLAELAALLIPLGVILLPALARARSGGRFNCIDNLHTMGIAFKMFEDEPKDQCYPILSARAGNLMFRLEEGQSISPAAAFCPDHVVTTTILERIESLGDERNLEDIRRAKVGHLIAERMQRPEDGFTDESYFYLGYLLTTEDQLEAFAEVYKQRIQQGLGFMEDLPAPPGKGSARGDRFLRLHTGIESELVSANMRGDKAAFAAAAKGIPVAFDRPGNHAGRDVGNVLYLDGHVAPVPAGSEGGFPYSARAIKALLEMDGLGPPPPN